MVATSVAQLQVYKCMPEQHCNSGSGVQVNTMQRKVLVVHNEATLVGAWRPSKRAGVVRSLQASLNQCAGCPCFSGQTSPSFFLEMKATSTESRSIYKVVDDASGAMSDRSLHNFQMLRIDPQHSHSKREVWKFIGKFSPWATARLVFCTSGPGRYNNRDGVPDAKLPKSCGYPAPCRFPTIHRIVVTTTRFISDGSHSWRNMKNSNAIHGILHEMHNEF